ncbi:restriction endonuclease [Acidaminobacter sp. JC074]|uniref:restriction endonuclease n=1 Tax=Acidaminobacter sp. JC074 TaxID=2530199 RepID=UPI001F0D288E|nr:restriction endonuclease [Acidaminobacter sp. JC074]MCH4890421.1 restriction endonuclease [Acidaminobacter sp. JC074]
MGMTLQELHHYNPTLAKLATKTELTYDEQIELKRLLALVENEEKEKISTFEKGKRLEDLVKYMFEITEVFSYISNGNTSSNEIDLTLIMNQSGRLLRNFVIPKCMPERIIVECKNYKTEVETKYANLFANLVVQSNADMGLFVSTHGLSGHGKRFWKDGVAAIHKFNLLHRNTDCERIILDVTLDDIELAINNGKTVYDMIMQLVVKMEGDVTKEVTYQSHEKSGMIKWE